MKKIIAMILILCTTNMALADCDWSKIKELPDGNFQYTAQLNICVGNMVRDSKIKDQQISDLTQAISLKDLAITKSDERSQMWRVTAEAEQDRMVKINSSQSQNNFLFFGLGILSFVMIGFATARLIK